MSFLEKMNSSLSGRALIYTVGNFALGASTFLASAVFVRMMSASDYGLSCVYITWVALVAQIIGLRIEGTVQNACLTYGKDNLRAYCSSVLFFDLLVSTVILTLSIVLIDPLSEIVGIEQDVWILVIVTAFFLTCSSIRKTYCSAIRNAPGDLAVSCILAFGQIGLSVLLIWFAVCGSDYLDRIWGYSVPAILVGIGICIYFFAKGRKFIVSKYWKFCLSFSVPMIFNGIAYLVVNQSDRLMLNSMMGSDIAGIYSFAYSIALPISVITQSLGTAWQPEYYELKAKGQDEQLKIHAKRYTTNVLLIMVLLMCVSPEVLIILGTQDYYSGLSILPMIILGYFFQFLYTWPLNCELFHRKTIGIAAATIIAATVNITLNYVLIPIWGMEGSAVATCVSFALLFAMHHAMARFLTKEYILKIEWFVPYALVAIAAAVVLTVLVDCMIARWMIGILVGLTIAARIKKHGSVL